ncbi:hypothetical protein N7517_007678 [Penicillium concentricum]|uniref:Mob1/phocein n=1 Tax=Penicillium concentricum TaxID=293559 RepID=A0A9W9VBB1_9EURO|nr:uncharacterized protein N7517_007678 [Penicillium concentricum]KAJ5375672.1 hypothetical protein N7517_007678 [Penicillium concentricum]
MTAAGVSPSSSPRLPSPPPFTEVQIGPQSPSVGESFGKDGDLLGIPIGENDGSTRRIRSGTKSANMASGPPVIPLSQINSPFPLQEHIKSHYYKLTAQYPKLMEKYDVLMEEYNQRKDKASDNVDPNYNVLMDEYNVLMDEYNMLMGEYNERKRKESDKVDSKSEVAKEPTKPESFAEKLTEPPEGVDDTHWIYELCRFFTMEVNRLVQGFLDESPPCSAQTCPEMRVVEWQYICALHPKQACCAIDYCCHTLDWAMDTLTSRNLFPSKVQKIESEGARYLPDIFRRLYRIFAHAWFRHPGVFSKVAKQGGLYVFFKTVCVHYNLVGDYTIPLTAGGPDEVAAAKKREDAKEKKKEAEKKSVKEKETEGKTANNSNRFTILRKEGENSFDTTVESQDPALVTGATTRRHKHSPSTGSRVTTIAEDAEDSEEITPSLLREPLNQSPEPRPVSVLGIQTRMEPTTTDEPPTDVGKYSKEPVEEPQEQPPQAPYEQPSETPGDQGLIEQVEQNEQAKEPVSEKSATNSGLPIEKYVTEGDGHKTCCEEATPAEQPEAKIEVAQEPSVGLETKFEPEKEES